jgi:hypothetical protein
VAIAEKILKNRSRGEVATVVTLSGRIDQPGVDVHRHFQSAVDPAMKHQCHMSPGKNFAF